jgi:membrane protease YdiL (CAAX protease family)
MALGFSLSYLIIVLILAYFIINKYKQSFFEALGVNVKSFIKGVILGLASYVSYLPFLFIALLISLGISSFFKMAPEENPLLNVFSIEGRPWLLFYFVLCICIIGPIVEELFFRGFLYPALRKKVGSILSIFLSAALFSLLHMTFVGFLPIFFLGILLAYIYEKSGSLLPSITIHIIHNSSITLFLLIIKGLGS